jgi:hypothetical protein
LTAFLLVRRCLPVIGSRVTAAFANWARPRYNAGMVSRFQFSIRFLLVATAAIAAGTAAVCAKPSWPSSLALGCLSVLFSTAGIVAAKQASGNLQTFWIGTAVVLALGPVFAMSFAAWFGMLMSLGPSKPPQEFMEGHAWGAPLLKLVLPGLWCAAPINGLVAVLLHWLFAPNRKPSA